ncbi:MAG: hypothetical protein M3Y53_12560 [Thermoproteota archaeon]|nr:hypothetical protein [Thermoproteota archaeon]
MVDSEKKNHDENLFQIMDGIISQLNRTKKMFIIMILTLMIIPPVSFAISSALFGPPIFFGGPGMHPEGFGPGFGREFAPLHFVPNLIFLIWLGVGIRQWYVLSKWSKKYQRYKELQKKLDEKLDYDNYEG